MRQPSSIGSGWRFTRRGWVRGSTMPGSIPTMPSSFISCSRWSFCDCPSFSRSCFSRSIFLLRSCRPASSFFKSSSRISRRLISCSRRSTFCRWVSAARCRSSSSCCCIAASFSFSSAIARRRSSSACESCWTFSRSMRSTSRSCHSRFAFSRSSTSLLFCSRAVTSWFLSCWSSCAWRSLSARRRSHSACSAACCFRSASS
mmetsp:Transcript_31311/g.88205  ORF Transcript_31311/g.88205 Transcript_31311/m.88205 type:complete len:202 (+) Transcript_31311:558-1163(+)